MNRRGFTLYIDESGDFESSPTVRSIAGGQRARNQIVGLLVPEEAVFDESVAQDMLRQAHMAAGRDLDGESHAKNQDNTFVDQATGCLLQCLSDTRLQVVRIVNREQVDYGSHDATYTHVVAELLIRIYSQCSREAEGRIAIALHGANVVRIRNGQKVLEGRHVQTIPSDEYAQRIREALAFIAVRLGHAEAARRWELVGVQLSPARKLAALQLCDLLSNASVDHFSRLTEETRARYRKSLGNYDFTLKTLPLLERIDEHAQQVELALALRLIAEHMVVRSPAGQLAVELDRRRHTLIERWARLSAPLRRLQSEALLGWLTQLERQRYVDLGAQLASWLLESFLQPVRGLAPVDPGELDEFEYGLCRWHLKLLTHQGRLLNARGMHHRMDELAVTIAGSVDAMPRLLEGQVAQAVHLTDCLEFEHAIVRLQRLDAVHQDMLRLFGKQLGGELRSSARGKVLSSWSQAETFAAAYEDRERLHEARQLNDLALSHFNSESDRAQAWQYRAQLETRDGEFSAARKALNLALSTNDSSHDALSTAITQPGFALLHWWRIGATALRQSGMEGEAQAFLDAYSRHPLASCPWDDSVVRTYPAQGLLRQAAHIGASNGKVAQTSHLLVRLGQICEPSQRPILGAIHIAALLECAATLWDKDRRVARLMLGESPNHYPGISRTAKHCRQPFAQLSGLRDWLLQAESISQAKLSGRAKSSELYAVAARIGY